MAKTPMKRPQPDTPTEEETAESRAQTDIDVLPGETIEEWVQRKNAEEGIGPDGRYTLDSRYPCTVDESTDPNMGNQ